MFPNEELLSQILEVLYEAPLDPRRWEEFVRLTAEAAGAHAATLLLHDLNDVQLRVAQQWGFDPSAIQPYEEHYSSLDLRLQAFRRNPTRIGTSQQLIPLAELKRTEYYNDFLLPQGMIHSMFGTVEQSPAGLSTLSLHRDHEAGPYEEQDLAFLRLLLPHVQRAFRLHSQIAASRNRSYSLQSALDSLAMAVILLAAKGQVVTMNCAAKRLLADNDGLLAHRQGLKTTRAGECARLQQLIAEATATSAGTGLRPAGALTVSRRDRPPLHLLVSPVRGFDLDEKHPVHAIVFVTDPAQRARPQAETLRALFGLTRAESRLAMLLADGHSPRAIAEMVGVSRNTLKSQLASTYRKTGTSRQAQLVRLLLQLPATSPSEMDGRHSHPVSR